MLESNSRRGGTKVARRASAAVFALVAVALVAVIAGCGGSDTKTVTVDSAKAPTGQVAPAFTSAQQSAMPTDNWLVNGGNLANQRYSPLNKINDGNVASLKGQWMTDLRNSGTAAKYSAEGQPLAYNGVLYVPTGADDVFAVDQATGGILWQYSANLSPSLASVVCCGWDNRGVGLGDGKVYVGQLDGKVVALDQKTGKVVWTHNLADPKNGYTITMPPLYYNGMIFVGPVGAEYGVRGQIQALNAKTGAHIWTHYNTAAPGEPGGDTWPAGTDEYKHGGATVWSSPAVDPETGTMFYSTANAGSDWDGRNRPGDNKWASSILALDLKTGKFKWGYQQVHHDIWDYDSPSPVVLMDSTVNGKAVQGLAQPSKTGYVYFLDRNTGKPIFPIPETKVPQSAAQPGTSPTQPIPTMAPFSPVTLSPAMVKSVEASVATATPKGTTPPKVVASPEFTPFEPVGAKTIKASTPGPAGGDNWEPSSYNPDTHYYYVCSQSNSAAVAIPKVTAGYKTGEATTGIALAGIDGFNTPGLLTAYNMDTGKIAWQNKFPDSCYSGAVSTGGNLLFVGRNKGELQAFNATTGKQLWSFQTGAGANSPVTTYLRDGKQYVTLLAGGNALAGTKHGDNLWTFSLDGQMGPVAAEGEGTAIQHAGEGGGDTSTTSTTSTDKTATAGGGTAKSTTGDATAGQAVFTDNCAACHGVDGKGGNGGPDLTTIPQAKTIAGVTKQVTNGGGGMPAFKGQLSDTDIANVAAYVTTNITNK
jgi:quinohemoprotein ethanol dehydrogenase